MVIQQKLTVEINLQYLASLLVILLIHLVFFYLQAERFSVKFNEQPQDTVLRIQEIRKVGEAKGSKKNDFFLAPKKQAPQPPNTHFQLDPFKAQAMMEKTIRNKNLSKDVLKTTQSAVKKFAEPTLGPNKKPAQRVTQIMKEVASSYAGAVQSSPTLSKTDINVNVEMPEGVKENELNEFELMFYTFQRRMMIKYVESIILKVRDFERTHPHRKIFPEGKHIMTGRVTFDKEGNIKQIKMVRWTHVQDLQQIFEDALKSMYSLPNPPKFLWEKNGEFTVFYNFVVNNI